MQQAASNETTKQNDSERASHHSSNRILQRYQRSSISSRLQYYRIIHRYQV